MVITTGEAKQILADFPDIKVSEKVQKVLDTLPDKEQVIFSLMSLASMWAAEQPDTRDIEILNAACLPSGTQETLLDALKNIDRKNYSFSVNVYPYSEKMLTAFDFIYYLGQGEYDLDMLKWIKFGVDKAIEVR